MLLDFAYNSTALSQIYNMHMHMYSLAQTNKPTKNKQQKMKKYTATAMLATGLSNVLVLSLSLMKKISFWRFTFLFVIWQTKLIICALNELNATTSEDAHESSQTHNVNIDARQLLMKNRLELVATLKLLVIHDLRRHGHTQHFSLLSFWHQRQNSMMPGHSIKKPHELQNI